MNQRMRLASLTLALGLGLTIRTDAQQTLRALPMTARPMNLRPRHRDIVAELAQPRLAPVEASIREVPFQRSQPRYDGIVYDNTFVPAGGGLSYLPGTTAFPSFNLLDDFNLFAGATEAVTPTPASVTSLTLGLDNYGTTTQTVYGTITFYDALDFSGTNVASMPLGSYNFSLTGANRPTVGLHAYALALPAPLALTHDIGSGAASYGIQIALYSNSARTTGHTKVTPLFNRNGVLRSHSFDAFWEDANNDGQFDPDTEGFSFGGGAGNLANFYLQLRGTTVNAPTYEIAGKISLPDLVATADVQKVTWTLHSLTGSPDIVIQGAVDPKAPESGQYLLFGLPPDRYHLNIKSEKFLAKNVADAMGSLQTLDLTAGNYLGSADVTLSGGDATNDNIVDIGDFSALVTVYTDVYAAGDPNAPAPDVAADFNSDGALDAADFGILVNNYGSRGDAIL